MAAPTPGVRLPLPLHRLRQPGRRPLRHPAGPVRPRGHGRRRPRRARRGGRRAGPTSWARRWAASSPRSSAVRAPGAGPLARAGLHRVSPPPLAPRAPRGVGRAGRDRAGMGGVRPPGRAVADRAPLAASLLAGRRAGRAAGHDRFSPTPSSAQVRAILDTRRSASAPSSGQSRCRRSCSWAARTSSRPSGTARSWPRRSPAPSWSSSAARRTASCSSTAATFNRSVLDFLARVTARVPAACRSRQAAQPPAEQRGRRYPDGRSLPREASRRGDEPAPPGGAAGCDSPDGEAPRRSLHRKPCSRLPELAEPGLGQKLPKGSSRAVARPCTCVSAMKEYGVL